ELVVVVVGIGGDIAVGGDDFFDEPRWGVMVCHDTGRGFPQYQQFTFDDLAPGIVAEDARMLAGVDDFDQFALRVIKIIGGAAHWVSLTGEQALVVVAVFGGEIVGVFQADELAFAIVFTFPAGFVFI